MRREPSHLDFHCLQMYVRIYLMSEGYVTSPCHEVVVRITEALTLFSFIILVCLFFHRIPSLESRRNKLCFLIMFWFVYFFTVSRKALFNETKQYSKTCLKRPLSKRPKIGFQDQLSLNAVQKYCRMLEGEHIAECSNWRILLSTFIKVPFVIKIFVLFYLFSVKLV